jgi:hypothetical protein
MARVPNGRSAPSSQPSHASESQLIEQATSVCGEELHVPTAERLPVPILQRPVCLRRRQKRGPRLA